MKTKLLYAISFLLIFFTSCSVDESITESSINEKEIKIKSFLDAFSKNAVNSSSYFKFVKGMQTKSSSGLTAEEMAELEQEFLSQQSAEFVALYNYIVNLNLSEDELRNIIIEYLSSNNSNSVSTKNDTDECALGDGGSSWSLLALVIKIFCEEGDTREDD
ncbi:hypothetical protein [Aquimarina rubra]|uniref:DUF3347 domain-containing protein n=1 Tax=Aquimarina rubra TaxID=1920033 RepID=A0ABW5LAA9_9FLAO